LINATRVARLKLKSLYRSRSVADATTNDVERAKNFLEWMGSKTEMVIHENTYTLPADVTLVQGMQVKRPANPNERLIQRGTVLWMDFGENIGQEFSGRHPGLILKVGGLTAVVVPLSSQAPTTAQLQSGIYAKIDHVYNFTPMVRWANVLNTTALSVQRFHFQRIGGVKGNALDNIKTAMRASKVFGH